MKVRNNLKEGCDKQRATNSVAPAVTECSCAVTSLFPGGGEWFVMDLIEAIMGWENTAQKGGSSLLKAASAMCEIENTYFKAWGRKQ